MSRAQVGLEGDGRDPRAIPHGRWSGETEAVGDRHCRQQAEDMARGWRETEEWSQHQGPGISRGGQRGPQGQALGPWHLLGAVAELRTGESVWTSLS